jgi:bifunctional ADP-heptose synthase (sugar kinase/adenylyltransferase)
VLNNLVALGLGTLYPVGFCGEDGEGYELRRALGALPGVRLEHFRQTPERRTFTYGKPLLVQEGEAPRELSRLDSKNWSPTPEGLSAELAQHVKELLPRVDAAIIMEQVDLPETGVVTAAVRAALRAFGESRPDVPLLADSRSGLGRFGGVIYKMNAAELAVLLGHAGAVLSDEEARAGAIEMARRARREVFVTMAERGILGASPDGALEHVASHPVHGEIDVVGAGDSVTANLGAALAAGGSAREAMTLAMAAASVVIHQLGTTGTASREQLSAKLA